MKKIFLFELFWFVLAQSLGVLVASRFIGFGVKDSSVVEVERVSFSNFDILKFLIAFLVVNVSFFLILKLKKGKNIIFKSFFVFSAFFGGGVFLQLLWPGIIPLFLISFLIVFWFLRPYVWLHNLLLVLSVAGIGGVVGARLQPEFVIFLFFILSFYDIISVYKTKQTVKLAKGMMNSFAVLGIIIPEKFSNFGKKLKEVKFGDKEQKFLILGSGDLVLPMVLACSFFGQGAEKSFIILFFSSLGLLFGFWLFKKMGGKPMPALPPIFIFSFIGYLIIKVLDLLSNNLSTTI